VDNLRAVGVDELGLLTEQRAMDQLGPTPTPAK
jgi:hypothetical protein